MKDRSFCVGFPSVSNNFMSWSLSLTYNVFSSLFFEHGDRGKHESPGNKKILERSFYMLFSLGLS